MQKPKYGAHCFLWIEKWENAHLSLFEHSKNLGLDVFEIAIGDDIDFTPKKIKEVANETGMEIVISPGAEWPMEADISLPDKKIQQYAIDWHKKWIEQGAEAGATAYTGAIYGHPGRINKVAPDQKEFERIVENLNTLAEFAAQHQVNLVLEPMSHFRTHVANTPEQLLNLIHGADHSNLSVLIDTYHLVTEVRDFTPGIRKLNKHIWGVHACENDRGVPGGGLMPWDSIFSALNEVDFKGYMILETYNSSIRNGDFAFSRGMFHNVCSDGDEFVKTGISFLNSMFNKYN